jgi:hypothetical protein
MVETKSEFCLVSIGNIMHGRDVSGEHGVVDGPVRLSHFLLSVLPLHNTRFGKAGQ